MSPLIDSSTHHQACTYASRVAAEYFVVAEPDESIKGVNSAVVPLGGALAACLQAATGKQAVFLGKPKTYFYQAIRRANPSLDPSRTLMIGDRLNTDIAFANQSNIRFSLLVETGEDSVRDATRAAQTAGLEHLVPTHSIDSLGHLFSLP